MQWLSDFYRDYLAYEYFSPGLMRLSYANLDPTHLPLLLLILLLFSLVFGLVPLLMWGVRTVLLRRGHLRGRTLAASRRILAGSLILAFLAALNATNNLWLSINN